MSRHRAVRNLDLEEELADGSYDEYDALDADALEAALFEVVETIGAPEECGISDREMREALWDAYFDPAEAINWLLQEKERKEAQARKQAGMSSSNTALPAGDNAAQSTPSKPLSKLQQKVLANKAKRAEAAASGSPVLKPAAPAKPAPQAAQAAQAASAAPQAPKKPVAMQHAPVLSERAEKVAKAAALFPPPGEQVSLFRVPSAFTAKLSCISQPSVSLDDWRFAGHDNENAAPFVPDAEIEQLRHAFSALSPDDQKERNRQQNAKKAQKAPPKAAEKPKAAADTLSAGVARMEIKPTPAKKLIPVDEILAQARSKQDKEQPISLVVVGHVDAGKSTLMGRMLLEFGQMSAREHQANERASQKIGKGSFAYAWALDSSAEERERGVTIDVAQDSFRTETRTFHLLDAPGHRDFVPNMISGASQADAAVLVVDSSTGEFEAGFCDRGQTREHVMLLRALGVQQLIVAVNKMDMVSYAKERFDEIVDQLKPFLAHTGFAEKSVRYVPCAAGAGENLLAITEPALSEWYDGPTLAGALDLLSSPERQFTGPLRLPVTNVFKGTTASVSSGLGVSGRILSGIVQVGEAVIPVPGDTQGVVKAIECDGDVVPWAVAGASVTLYLAGLEDNQVSVGDMLCSPSAPVALCSSALVQVLVFQPTYPLVTGTAVEAFHHSADIPSQLTELVSLLDKGTGEEIKKRPRVLPPNSTALVRVAFGNGTRKGYPIETFRTNKEMSRLLFRMNGESVAAGIAVEVFP
ncbi:hypothetical protein MCUN1_002071 [Malassezia cuniculi]|uniref:Elongation factor 1 alpha-like protein n=1 Tax=Malassezia cuniculi TaxID=948313 RepID=A0AAF0JBE8_9BASI|nr:hypothetical protein MCUN1_002071 [Malassezia cuniculi]